MSVYLYAHEQSNHYYNFWSGDSHLSNLIGSFTVHAISQTVLPYSRKYWRSLNLAVWPQVAEIKILADLNLVVVLRSVICHYIHYERVDQEALPSSALA